MKSVMRSLLIAGLFLFPVLALAASEGPSAVASPTGAGDLFSAESFGLCSEAPAAQVGLELEGRQDCEADSGGLSDSIAPASMEKKPGGCKACPQQPWCACTYQGHPRISCDPCCYQTYAGQICTS